MRNSLEAPATAPQAVELDGLTHRYGATTAVDNVTLTIKAGEIAALLGPSGCGKTTLLRIIAGFVRQNAGRVIVGGSAIDDLPANRRNVGIVFQNYALFPHMTAAENIAYGLRARGQSKHKIKPTVARFLDVVRLGGLADRLPRQLSGGQQQRVALARCLAVDPKILMLVGHNPGMHELALALTGGGEAAARKALADNLPTSGLAVFDFAGGDWADVAFRRGRLVLFVTPKGLRQTSGE